MNRTRHCWAVLIGLALVAHLGLAAEGPAAKLKPWRIIVNDDGEVPPPHENRTVAQTLDDRFNETRGTQVDAYFICIASTDRVVAPAAARPQDCMSQWAKYGKVPQGVDDMVTMYIEQAHKEGIDIILAARLNDIHDSWEPKLTYPLKVERPDLLLGKRQTWAADAVMKLHWSAFNWAEPEVRKHFLDFIMWACAKWDFDGVELDWFRHPLFFRLGEAQANVKNMTQFVRDTRKGLNEIAKKRGRRYLLTARPPDSPKLALRTGFDVEQWLKEGLLDMLMVGGGYMPHGARVKEFIDMAHRHGVHAYPCQNHFIKPEEMHSIASGMWALGADGFYIFNYDQGVGLDPAKVKCLRQLGSLKTLAGLDKRFLPDTGCKITYLGHTNPNSQFPMPLIGGDPIELVVGDDLAKVKAAGTDVRLTLQLKVSHMNNLSKLADVVGGAASGESIAIQVNGRQLPGKAIRRIDATTFVADLDASALVNGINKILVLAGPKAQGRLASAVNSMELIVDYPPHAPAASKPAPKAAANDKILVSPISRMPVSLFDVPVGTSKSIRFDLPHDPASMKAARLALTADDFDAPEELTIALNGGKPLTIPDAGKQPGMMDVPLAGLPKGQNEVVFTLVSTLGGTTKPCSF